MIGKKKILLVGTSVPFPNSGGSGNRLYSLLEEFSHQNYKVIYLGVIGKHKVLNVKKSEFNWIKKRNIELHLINYESKEKKNKFSRKFLKYFFPKIKDFFPNEYEVSKKVCSKINEIDPDCVLAFAFDALIYTNNVKQPRVAFQSEGPHINESVNLKFKPKINKSLSIKYIIYYLKQKLLIKALSKIYIKLIKKLDITIFNAPHYLYWSISKGIKNSIYLPTQIYDPNIVKTHIETIHKKPFKILLIGHLRSTNNSSSLPLFFEEILPSMDIFFDKNEYLFNIVGDNNDLPSKYQKYKSHNNLIWKGPVYPASLEFIDTDVLLVPISAKTGPRIRIINGFSLGCCIVAHEANKLGIPELEHEQNILIGKTGYEIAYQIYRASKDKLLRKKLGKEGRTIYEKNYKEGTSLEINKLIERLLNLEKIK